VEVEDMVHMAMKVERQLKRKRPARYTSVSSTPWKQKWDRNDQAVVKGKAEPPKGKDKGTNKNKPKVDFQPSRNRDIKCFKCLGLRHIASQCPNKRVMVMRDNGEVMTDSDEMHFPNGSSIFRSLTVSSTISSIVQALLTPS
jgi:hypothetical protein